MSRHTKSEIWRYFEYVNLDSAKCNKCGKFYSRKGRTTTSLKNHLRSSHPQEFLEFLSKDTIRLENKRGLQIYDLLAAKPINQPQHHHSALVNENATTASTSGYNGNSMFESNDLKNNFYDINTRTLESNESYSTDSITLSPTIIKQEVFIEPENLQSENLPQPTNQVKAIAIENERQRRINEVGNVKNVSSQSQDQKSETHHDEPDDPLDVPVKTCIEDEDFVEPLPKMRRDSSSGIINIISDYLNEPPFDFEELQQKPSLKEPQDRLEKSPPPPSKDDKFERWLTKRKRTLELEYQEMLNYELKLKIWEREQQLNLPRSKFTKNIGN